MIRNHKFNIVPNLLDRNFTADQPNQRPVGDITYWIDSNVWPPRCLAAMILSGSAVHLNGLAWLSLYSVMKRLIAA